MYVANPTGLIQPSGMVSFVLEELGMIQNRRDPAPENSAPGGEPCPKCGVEMEPIETGIAGPELRELLLCPSCYLVTWTDLDGLHARQGVPVKKGTSQTYPPGWLAGEPREC